MKQNPLLLSVGGLPISVRMVCVGVRGSVEPRDEAWSVSLTDGMGTGVFLLPMECKDGAFLDRVDLAAEWKTTLRFGTQLGIEAAERYQVMLSYYPAGAPYPGARVPGGGWALEDGHPSLWVAVVDLKEAPSEEQLRAELEEGV